MPMINFRRHGRYFIYVLLLFWSFLPNLFIPCPAISGLTDVKRVLILYSQNEGHQAHEWTDVGLRASLKSNDDFEVVIYTEYLDLSRFRGEEYQATLADFINKKYHGMKFDLIIPVYKAAAEFLINHGGDNWAKAPTIFVSVDKRYSQTIEKSYYGGNTTGIFLTDNIDHIVSTALKLKPDARRIVVISGVSETDKERKEIIFSVIEKYREKLQLLDLSGLSMNELMVEVAGLPSDSIVFYSTMFLDVAGRSFVPKEAVQRLAAVSAAPIFGFYEGHLGYGIVGGRLLIHNLQGERAGNIGLRILRGEAPGSIPFDNGEDTCADLYDWRQLKKWGLNENLLPAGSTIRFRPSTAWDLYKWHIIGITSFVAIETFLIIDLVINLRKRKKAEHALRDNQAELKALAGKLISSREEELRQLAREIHDDLTQRLAVLAIEAGKLELEMKDSVDAPTRNTVGKIKNQLIKVSEDVHALSRQIHPSILEDLGLVRALQSECVYFSDRENITVTFVSQAIPDRVPKDIGLCLYRVTQEALRNIAKHSQSHSAEIMLKRCNGGIYLSIKDDGIGFAPSDVRNAPGIGLNSLRERVQFVNGNFSITSQPGQGSLIEVSIPITRVG